MGAFDAKQPIVIPNPNNPEQAAAFREKWGWEPHEQVILRGVYTAGHMAAVQNASVHSDIGSDQASSRITLATGDGRLKLMECLIIGWTFKQGGQDVPVSIHAISQLPYHYMQPILEECDKISGTTLNQEQQKSFLTSANGHISVDSDLVSPLPTKS